MNMIKGLDITLIKDDKFIRSNIPTLSTLKFVYDNSFYMKIKCVQNKYSEIEIQKSVDKYTIINMFQGLKPPGIILTLSNTEVEELMRSYPNLITKIHEWVAAYNNMSHDTVN